MKVLTTFFYKLKTKLSKREIVKTILRNSLWLSGDRVLRMSVGIFINVWVARYLGPEQFGLWSYCISFAGLFVVFSNLGLDAIVVRELIKYPEKEYIILGTAFLLKFIAGFLTFGLTLVAIYLVRNGENIALWLVGFYSAGYIFQSLNVINFYYESKVQSKFIVISSGFAFIISTIAKILLLLNHAQLLAFAAVGLLEVVFTSIFSIIVYRFNLCEISKWSYHFNIAKQLLNYSWPMILSGLSIMISLRVDQIMIGNILGDREVGVFAAAARMSELSFFIPSVIITSSTASIIHAKQLGNQVYLKRLQNLLDLTMFISLCIAILITFTSTFLIQTLFGSTYAEAAPLLAVHAWSGLFSCLGAVSGIWMMSEGLQKKMFYRTFYGMLVNVILNYFLIPTHGTLGAAIATICSFIMMGYISDLFSMETRKIFYMKTRSLFLSNMLFKVIKL